MAILSAPLPPAWEALAASAPAAHREAALERAPAPRQTVARSIRRFLTECRESLERADGRRMAWSVAAMLPELSFPCARARLLSLVGCDIPRGVAVLGYVELIGPPGSARNLRIGTGSMICPRTRFWLDAPITLGQNVTIGPGVQLCTATHRMGGPSRRMRYDVSPRPIVIEDGAWVAFGAVILPGVTVGRGAVVGAGAIVSKDVPENVLVVGNPAVVVRRLPLS